MTCSFGLSAHIRILRVPFLSFPVAESDDEEIAEAVSETIAAIEGSTGEEGDEEDEWVNYQRIGTVPTCDRH
jgi:hypothetical protein